jgi:outer membrane protein OmpA-like peptidoglycan-associated protein
LAAVCCLGISLAAYAPEPAGAQESADINAQNFEPTIGPHGIFTVEGASTVGHLKPWGGLTFSYLSEPVVSRKDDGTTEPVVDEQFAMDLRGAVGFFGRTQLGVHVPMYLANTVELDGESLSGASVGDLSIQPKVRILDRNDMPLGLGALFDVTVPTGNSQSFVGAAGPTVTPEILVDDSYGRVVLATNLGVRFQPDRTFRNLETGHTFTYRVGAKYRFVEGLLHMGGEIYGETPLANFGAKSTSPVEGLLGIDVMTDIGLAVSGGAGAGIAPGIGAPEFRAFLGVSYPGVNRDADNDGVPDDEDDCPEEPEDIDGFEDADGCPDTDNDGDGIADRADECPNKAEDKNGFKDMDGCPDATSDTDGDGIADRADECPNKAEDEDGYRDGDGCPDPDSDGDDIADNEDECPNKPGLKANDGCPPDKKKAVLGETVIQVKAEIRFETESADLKGPSSDILDQVGLVLRTNDQIEKLEIQGHADARGTDEFNQKLSERRAESVKRYLVEEAGVSADRLVAKGYGEKLPAAPNETAEDQARNRRVAFKILEERESE